MYLILLFLLFPLTLCSTLIPQLHYEWTYINFTWPTVTSYESAVRSGSYIKEHNVVSGIKHWRGRLYLAVPRFKNGVPVTLTSMPENGAELLEPFPSWEMQTLGDCRALQFVQSFEIDPQGRMWVIDNGRVEIRTNKSRSLCPPRLVIFDLEDNGTILLNYAFPYGVVQPSTVYLNEIVVDHEDDGYAYISDNDSQHPGIIVFSLRERRSWKVYHPTMRANPAAFDVIVNSTKIAMHPNIKGMALSPASVKNRLVYYAPLSSYQMFTIPTRSLKSGSSEGVRLLGIKPLQSDGMTMSAKGRLFFGYVGMSAIVTWDTGKPPFSANQVILAQNEDRLQWPDSFGISANGVLYNSAKRQLVIRSDKMVPSRKNFRITRTDIGARGYQYYEDGNAPTLPVIREETLFDKLWENLKVALRIVIRRVVFL